MGFKQGELLAIKAEIETLITRREGMVVKNEMCRAKGDPPSFDDLHFHVLEDQFWDIVTYVKDHME